MSIIVREKTNKTRVRHFRATWKWPQMVIRCAKHYWEMAADGYQVRKALLGKLL